MEQVKLTQYSHGAGCGCKISPAVLDTILRSDVERPSFSSLLVGNESRDDAAVYELGDGPCIVSTTDFFMPIVDDPFTFGSIASVNAISDVYAMGGEPLMAIAILGWPINSIAPEIAKRVLEGSRDACSRAGIPLAGGHSIDCPEPVFGLAVTGKVKKENLKRNDSAKEGSVLYLTKPLGVGIITTAQKKGIVHDDHLKVAIDSMLTLNKSGAVFGKLAAVTALTDVTGFGLLGHLRKMAAASGVDVELDTDAVPLLPGARELAAAGNVSGGTRRTREWVEHVLDPGGRPELDVLLLADAQTSGGLLFGAAPQTAAHAASELGPPAAVIGRVRSGAGRITLR